MGMVSDAALSRSLDDAGGLLYALRSYSSVLRLQLMEGHDGHPKFLRCVGLLYIVLGVTVDISCVLLSVGALFMAHSQNHDHPYYVLYPCYLVLFSLHHCLTTLPTWLFLVRKVVCSAISTCWKLS